MRATEHSSDRPALPIAGDREGLLVADDQPPTVTPISTESTICVNWTFTVGMRRLVYHDPKIVAASGTGSGYVPGHGGRRHIAATTEGSTCAIRLRWRIARVRPESVS